MNPLSPLTQSSKGKSNVRLAVISIIALHAVFFGGLLLQGCKPKTTDSGLAGVGAGPISPTNELPPLTQSNLPPFGADTAQPGLAGQPFADPMQPITPPVATNELWTAPAWPAAESLQPVPTPATTEYVVKAGDYPARIAKDHGVSLNALMQANPGLQPTKLQIGQRIQIPAPAPAAANSAMAPGTEPGDETALTYVVKAGDNLTKIARLHGVTIKEIRAANNLKTDRILVGQKLKIPGAKPASAPGERVPSGVPL